MPDVLNNREWAIVIWCLIGLVWMMTQAPIRRSLFGFLHALLAGKIVLALLLFAGWIAGACALGAKAGVWDFTLLKDTAVWYVFAGVLLLANMERVGEPRYVRRVARETLAFTVVVQFLISMRLPRPRIDLDTAEDIRDRP